MQQDEIGKVPNNGTTRGSAEAKAWAADLAQAFGDAVKKHRTRLGLSAVQLANRCKEIGYPITRATLAKIESNARAAKMDVAEVLTLAAALEVAPVDLVFPGYPDQTVPGTPRVDMTTATAAEWFTAADTYNEYEQLHSPRITRSKETRQAVEDYRHAVESFEKRHQVAERNSGGYILAAVVADPDTGELAAGWRGRLTEEYERISSLRDRVATAGGHVDLPAWFGSYEGSPF